jgi:UDP-N-acetylmuramyl pentapeptide phosphotransferase/UDP-N-acetylglucosamine-1-phosphate transferase
MAVALISIGVALGVSWIATRWVLRHALGIGLLDVPNERSSHLVPTPRGGGVGVFLGLAGAWIVAIASGCAAPWVLATALSAVAAVGFWDDVRHGVAARVRLVFQALASLTVIVALGPFDRLPLPEPLDLALGPLGWPITLFWMLAVINIFNFLDGIDGFAGTQGLMGGIGLALLPGPLSAQMLGWSVTGACAGFLWWNWHPARIFLGDVGSTTLGFLFAAVPLLSSHSGAAAYSVAILLWVFLADGTFTIIRRLCHGERLWEAHRSHLYQRLVVTGLRHSDVTARVGLLMVGCCLLAVWAARNGSPAAGWLAGAAALIGFGLYWGWVRHRTTAARSSLSNGE